MFNIPQETSQSQLFIPDRTWNLSQTVVDEYVSNRGNKARIFRYKPKKIIEDHAIQAMKRETLQFIQEDFPDYDQKARYAVDLLRTTFLSSDALGMLMGMTKHEIEMSQDYLSLCAVRPEIREVFNITKLNRIFRFYDNRAEFLASL